MSSLIQPYPEYKDSGVTWLGQVPAHWKVLPNRALLKLKKQVVGGQADQFTLLSLTKQGVIARNMEKPEGKFPASFDSYQVIEPGDLIFCLFDIDETPCTVGLSSLHGMITGAYTRFSCEDELTRRFIYLLYSYLDDGKQLKPLYSGLRKVIPKSTFLSAKLALPPPDEQHAIVRYLDHMDRRIRRYIRARQRLIALLGEQKQAIIHQAVTRGLDPSVPLKPSGVEWLGDVPAHWEVKALKYAFESMVYGISAVATDTGGIPLLTMGNIRDGNVSVPENGGVDSVDNRFLLAKGDLLYNRTNSAELVGKVGLYRTDSQAKVTYASYLVRLRPQEDNDPEFLNLLLNSPTILSTARQLAVPSLHQSNLNPTRYGRIQIALPPVEEQRHIVAHLRDRTGSLDRMNEVTTGEIDLMREYRTRLIADVVTGKVDVCAAAANLPAEFDEPGDALDDSGAEDADLDGDTPDDEGEEE